MVESHRRVVDSIEMELEILESKIAQMSLYDVRARRLMTIPGIGHITAITILAEVADHKRFPSAEKMASYAGLVPSHRNSGDVKRDVRITKTGSVWLRNTMVEAATTAVRYDPRLKAKYEKLSARIGKMKAKVAIARTMTEIVWYMLIDETSTEPQRSYKTQDAANTPTCRTVCTGLDQPFDVGGVTAPYIVG